MSAEPAAFVRWIEEAEKLDDLVNEAKYRTWQSGVEHAQLVLVNEDRPMLVKGGKDGIIFDVGEIDGVEMILIELGGVIDLLHAISWHTHPRVTGPSDGDREALRILGQLGSVIYEIGGEPDGTIFGPDKAKPRR